MLISIGFPLIIVSFFSLNEMPSFLNFKPFNCNLCLSLWVVIIAHATIYFYPQIEPIANTLAYGGIAAYVSMIAKRLLFKI